LRKSDSDEPPPSAEPRRSFDRDLSDGELVLRARGGDRWATEVLFRRHVAHATRLATRLMARRCDADDVVQDAFAEVLTSLSKLREPEAFRAWLSRIVVTRCRRGLKRRRLARVVGLDGRVDDSTLEQLACGSASPETLAELRNVDEVLRRLPTETRVAWVLRYVQQETLEAVAELTGCSLATAKRRIRAAQVIMTARFERGQR
jgi:RNA polymerase sigma-70 factor (ECF subfamily)